MSDPTELASGLRFPEGPVAMPDGSVVLVEIERGTLTKIRANGTVSYIVCPGGGPNGAALGPDGRMYLCNNGGLRAAFVDRLELVLPCMHFKQRYCTSNQSEWRLS